MSSSRRLRWMASSTPRMSWARLVARVWGFGCCWGGGYVAREGDCAADTAGDAVEGECGVGFGPVLGCGDGGGAFVDVAGEVCALVDEVVEDGSVVGVVFGVGLGLGRGWHG